MNTPSQLIVPLRALAHSRSGDKGNRSNISVIPYHPDCWDLLLEQVTEQRVRALFEARRPSLVTRYLLPRLHAMNFVLDDVLDGGVNGSLNLDAHGKTLSSLMLTLPVQLEVAQARELKLHHHLHGELS
ncbi:MAG: AtuA-related protein [Hydrogenophaga sp.]|jgi:hypothetical protein|uniref:AtuA-related protein n=2 Tax=Hydrogenophaga sp. TaxID=1904254 RepID=UPI001D1DB8F5|nr:hypothetical protein [Hydrogenophaga sp.]MBW0171133.1 hypothetical protein [Hydrogenophaga sp.]MBW0184566.1 hypothetical protein [Hydrogenophaga sp.]